MIKPRFLGLLQPNTDKQLAGEIPQVQEQLTRQILKIVVRRHFKANQDLRKHFMSDVSAVTSPERKEGAALATWGLGNR